MMYDLSSGRGHIETALVVSQEEKYGVTFYTVIINGRTRVFDEEELRRRQEAATQQPYFAALCNRQR